MSHKTALLLTFFCFWLTLKSPAQDKWDLKRCVQYAVTNNISVRQADIDARTANLTYNQSKAAQFGQLNFATQLGANFGRSIDPTTNLFTTNQSLYQGISLQGGANLFNWFSMKRAVESNKYYYDAYVERIDKMRSDVTLNVAASYLQALLARGQVFLAVTKLDLTRDQLTNTRKLVDAGSVPELNAAELEAQFATDTSSLIAAEQTYQTNLLQLKALLSLDAAVAFELDTPAVESIPVEPISELQPDLVYSLAEKSFPQQKMDDLLILSAAKSVQSIKGQLYPTLSVYGSLGNNFANEIRQTIVTPGPFAASGLYADNPILNQQYTVYNPTFVTSHESQPVGDIFKGYWTQLNDNFRQQIGLQLSIPIFNGNQVRTNYEKAKLNVKTANLTKENDLLTLKNNVYTAYYNAVSYLQKFEAGKKAVSTAERSFDLATKRYNIGLLNTIDYLTNQNNLFTARINQLVAQYNYVFSMKVLEYYKGMGVKL